MTDRKSARVQNNNSQPSRKPESDEITSQKEPSSGKKSTKGLNKQEKRPIQVVEGKISTQSIITFLTHNEL
jgi:hypothetical protein